MKVTVTVVEGEQLAARWRQDANRVDRIAQAALSHIGDEFVNAARQIAGGTGAYPQSFTVRPSGSMVEAGSKSPLAAIIEKGRRPGRRPPPQSIAKRSNKGGAAAVRAADRIATQGTRGRYVVRRANTRIRQDGTIERIARRALITMIEGD